MKNWYESKTVWFNVLAALVLVATYFGYGDFVADQRVVDLIGALAAVINIALRFRTSQALK